MITEFLLDIVFRISYGILSFVPDFTWGVETTAFVYFIDIIRVVGYMLPVPTVIAILTLIFSLTIFRIVIAVIRTVWDLLPFA